jgi:hypothetical protein
MIKMLSFKNYISESGKVDLSKYGYYKFRKTQDEEFIIIFEFQTDPWLQNSQDPFKRKSYYIVDFETDYYTDYYAIGTQVDGSFAPRSNMPKNIKFKVINTRIEILKAFKNILKETGKKYIISHAYGGREHIFKMNKRIFIMAGYRIETDPKYKEIHAYPE